MVHIQFTVLLLLATLSSCQAEESRKPPNIIEPNSPKSLYFSGNSNVTLECKAEGSPTPTYKWMRNGEMIKVDQFMQYDSTRGTLSIPDFTKREEGTYMCIASNVFDNQGARVDVSSFAPPIKIFQTRVEKFYDAEPSRQQVSAYEYVVLKCDNKGDVVGNDINTNWYESTKSKDVSMDSGRLFIDQNGNLHFSYSLEKDSTKNFFIYLCGISSTSDKLIRLGNAHNLNVEPVANPTAIKPQLQYSNSGVKALRFGRARLECVFSGYAPIEPHVPEIHWYDDSGKEILGDSVKYIISDDRRVLTINSVQEEDEKSYFCQAKSHAGDSNKVEVFLNVTSAPIFHPSGAPRDQIVVENVDVTFSCDARSASNEGPPTTPIWYINGLKMGQHSNPTKYRLSSDNKRLTIMKVKKASDILCVQCEMTNSEDTTWGDACLTVILPITIETKPAARQEIDHGDVIDLTITAKGDFSTPLKYKWEFKNETYQTDAPPFVDYDPDTKLAYINTSMLSEAQYDTVGGIYRRTIYHEYQTVVVEVEVVLKEDEQGTTEAETRTTIATEEPSEINTTRAVESSTSRLPISSPPTGQSIRNDFDCHLTHMDVYVPVELAPNSVLRLKDSSCQLQNNGTHYVTSFTYDQCNTTMDYYYTNLVLVKNEITVHVNLDTEDLVWFSPDYTIPLTCVVRVNNSAVDGAFQAVDRDPYSPQYGQSPNFEMKEYNSSLYQDEITQFPVKVPINREVYFELCLINARTNSSGIKVDKCEATPTSNANDPNRFLLISDGCPATQAVKIQPRPGLNRFRFSVQTFHFSAPVNQDNLVYVHCYLSLCLASDCATTCPEPRRRRRRSSRRLVSETLISGVHIITPH